MRPFRMLLYRGVSNTLLTWSGAFRSAETERDFIKAAWTQLWSRARIVLGIGLLAILAGSAPDYLSSGFTPEFWVLLGLRLLSAFLCLAALGFLSRKQPRYGQLQWILALFLASIYGMLLTGIVTDAGEPDFFNYLAAVLIVIFFHILLPTEIWSTMAISATGNMALVGLSYGLHGMALDTALYTAATLLAANGVSLLVARFNRISARETFLAQRRLEESKRNAEDASKAKSAFLAHMSHELRTPLNAIIGFAEFAEMHGGTLSRDRLMEYFGIIRESGMHLLGIINNVLDLSKIEAGRMELEEEVIDLRGFLRSVREPLESMASSKDIDLRVVSPSYPVTFTADRRLLKQVLFNILGNALKFSPPNTSVALAARVAGTGLTFTVRDHGRGMAPEEIEQALEPFSQVEDPLVRAREGTGLGLPLALHYTALHGGTLTIMGRPGRGTSVHIRLPASRVLPAKSAKAGAREISAGLSGIGRGIGHGASSRGRRL